MEQVLRRTNPETLPFTQGIQAVVFWCLLFITNFWTTSLHSTCLCNHPSFQFWAFGDYELESQVIQLVKTVSKVNRLREFLRESNACTEAYQLSTISSTHLSRPFLDLSCVVQEVRFCAILVQLHYIDHKLNRSRGSVSSCPCVSEEPITSEPPWWSSG